MRCVVWEVGGEAEVWKRHAMDTCVAAPNRV